MAVNTAEAGRSVTSKITSILLTFTQGNEHSLTEIARLAGACRSPPRIVRQPSSLRGVKERIIWFCHTFRDAGRGCPEVRGPAAAA